MTLAIVTGKKNPASAGFLLCESRLLFATTHSGQANETQADNAEGAGNRHFAGG